MAQLGPAPAGNHRIAAAGDIACPPGKAVTFDKCHQEATARQAYYANPGAVLLLGDIQYDIGALKDYQASFDKSWGALRKRWWPSPGNHEYNTTDATGYFGFFGKLAGTPGQGYYSFEIGRWHLVALNSNCKLVKCGSGSAQMRWLRADLAAHQSRCTAAFWHHPLYSSGRHGDNHAVAPLWKALRKSDAEFVLSGHDHSFERFAPQDHRHNFDRRNGIRQFVVGTGGEDHRPIKTRKPNSKKALADVFGVMIMDLGSTSYKWRFVDEHGVTRDRGSDRCH